MHTTNAAQRPLPLPLPLPLPRSPLLLLLHVRIPPSAMKVSIWSAVISRLTTIKLVTEISPADLPVSSGRHRRIWSSSSICTDSNWPTSIYLGCVSQMKWDVENADVDVLYFVAVKCFFKEPTREKYNNQKKDAVSNININIRGKKIKFINVINK